MKILIKLSTKEGNALNKESIHFYKTGNNKINLIGLNSLSILNKVYVS